MQLERYQREGELPCEILEKVFTYLDPPDLCVVACVCRKWNDIVRGSEWLWRRKLTALNIDRSPPKETEEPTRGKLSRLRRTTEKVYRKERVKSRWLEGVFSFLSYSECKRMKIPLMCPMSCEDWGEILEYESGKTSNGF